MSKPHRSSGTWKIVLILAGAALAAVVLLTASAYVTPHVAPNAAPDPGTRPATSMASLLQLLGLMCALGSVVCAGLLGYRYYLSIPAWKRRKGPPKLH